MFPPTRSSSRQTLASSCPTLVFSSPCVSLAVPVSSIPAHAWCMVCDLYCLRLERSSKGRQTSRRNRATAKVSPKTAEIISPVVGVKKRGSGQTSLFQHVSRSPSSLLVALFLPLPVVSSVFALWPVRALGVSLRGADLDRFVAWLRDVSVLSSSLSCLYLSFSLLFFVS